MEKKRILIADDEPQISFCVSLALKMRGYEINTVENGEQALKTVVAKHQAGLPFDLLICDIQMPKMSGEELIKRLNDLHYNIPILVITGFGEKDLIIRLMRLGCRDFIDKPFEPSEIEEHVEMLLNSAKRESLERVRMERQAQIASASKELAHDFNNVIQSTVGYADMVLKKIDPSHPARKSVEKLFASAGLAAEISRRLLSLRAGEDTGACTRTEMRLVVERVAEILRAIAPETITVTAAVPDHAVWYMANGERLQQALLNLGMNSIDAMPNGGSLNMTLSVNAAQHQENIPAGPGIGISVSDTGQGMDRAALAKVFTKKFTTKNNGHGHGLSIVKSVADEHGAKLSVQSVLGKGTVISLAFPVILKEKELQYVEQN